MNALAVRPDSVVAPGVHPGVSYEAYARWPGLRSSYLRHFDRSPMHARESELRPAPPSPAMDLGTAIHCAILEPDALEQRYVRGLGIDRRSNMNKVLWAEFEAQHDGKGILSDEEWETAHCVRDSVWRQPWAQALLAGPGASELSVAWEDLDYGVPCKARIDRYCAEFDGAPTLVDFKSTRDASLLSFQRDVENFQYYLQASFYLDGMSALADRFRRWLWIAVEKTRPYGVALYEPDQGALDEGRAQYKAAIAAHLEAEREQRWRGYPQTPQTISLRPWARRHTRRAMEDAGL